MSRMKQTRQISLRKMLEYAGTSWEFPMAFDGGPGMNKQAERSGFDYRTIDV